MSKPTQVLVFLAGAIPLLLVAIAAYTWMTIPPTPDPDAIPSSVLEPPSAEYLDAVEEGRRVTRELIAEEKLPGLSLAVAVAGEMVWAEGFRWANMEDKTPVTPATLFRIGGVSETLTAAAVGVLSDRGLLDLDEPVQRYVPEFPEKQWPITTRQLMAHVAGLRPHRGEGGLFPGPGCTEDAERLALFAADSLRVRPGTEYHYSNFGWTLVGAVVAGVADEPYLDFLQREVFAPLGMNSTFPDPPGRVHPGIAHFYYPRLMLNPRHGLQDAPKVDLSCYLPAVGFLSTASDLVRLGSAMMDDSLLDPATARELQTPVQLTPGEAAVQALGWTGQQLPTATDSAPVHLVGQGLGEVVRRQPLSAMTVGGQVAGGTASLLTVPEHRVAIAVMTNVTASENVAILATRLAGVFVQVDRP